MSKITFVLYFGNRGFFPESLITAARKEMKDTLGKMGYQTLVIFNICYLFITTVFAIISCKACFF
jgi:hypothetical protein